MSKVWDCKIGVTGDLSLRSGADFPMRQAVREAFQAVTGQEAEFIFSGWGGKLTEGELAVVENRLPREELCSVEITQSELTTLRAENELMREALNEIGFKRCEYTTGEDHSRAIWIARNALAQVAK